MEVPTHVFFTDENEGNEKRVKGKYVYHISVIVICLIVDTTTVDITTTGNEDKSQMVTDTKDNESSKESKMEGVEQFDVVDWLTAEKREKR